ncbi:arylesterase [Desulfoplanes sp.]
MLSLACCLLLIFVGSRANAMEPSAATPATHILAFGDSLTAGYRLGPDQGFAARLEKKLLSQGVPVRVTNAGVSGDTTSGGRSRLAWSLADTPDLVILELGANDALRGIDPSIVRDNLRYMIETCLDNDCRVLLCGITPPGNFGPEYAREFSGLFPELAEQYAIPLYPDFLEGVLATPGLTLDDGLHPNPDGVETIVAGILPLVKTILASIADHNTMRTRDG